MKIKEFNKKTRDKNRLFKKRQIVDFFFEYLK